MFQKTTRNSLEARTTGAIAILPTGNLTGSIKFLSLATARVVTRNQFTIMPMPRECVNFMNDWANLKADIPGNLTQEWSKYLQADGNEEDGHEIDQTLPIMLERYRVPMVDIDGPRIPEPEVPVTLENNSITSSDQKMMQLPVRATRGRPPGARNKNMLVQQQE